MLSHSGGHTSILRLATEISKQGYEVQYVLLNNQRVSEAKKIAKLNLEHYRGVFVNIRDFVSKKEEVIIATASNTVFQAMNMEGYKMYFVQDYEPTFFALGDRYLMAKKTYEVGFHIVSLGKWNYNMIRKECHNINCINYIDFPCEISEYPFIKRNFSKLKGKKEIIIAAYIKMVGRRLPLITQELLKSLKDLYKKKGIKVKIFYFGEDKGLRCEGGVNIGKLSRKQLYELYQKADFGYVSSYSNISIIPYEMISSGLPVIEIMDGSFQNFFSLNCAILTETIPKDLYKKMEYYIENPKELEEMVNNAASYIKDLNWESSARQFIKCMEDEIS